MSRVVGKQTENSSLRIRESTKSIMTIISIGYADASRSVVNRNTIEYNAPRGIGLVGR